MSTRATAVLRASKRYQERAFVLEWIPLADMPSLIRLQPETFSRLVKEASRRHETIDDAADRILRERLPVIRDANSTLATLGRLEQLRVRMKPGKGAVRIVHEGRRELERRQFEQYRSCGARCA